MAVFHSPRVTTNGLILCLDAGNIKSYPRAGSTWFDLSTNNNSGALNSITYSNNTLNFGSTSVATVSMTNLRPTSQITQESWFRITTVTGQVFIGAQYGTSSNNSYALWSESANSWNGGVNIGGSFNFQAHSQTMSTNVYYHFVHTYDGSQQRLYINGENVRTWATSGSIAYDTNNTLLAVGNDWDGSGYNSGANSGVRGDMPVVRIYNRAISATEVRDNFNALRLRFGI